MFFSLLYHAADAFIRVVKYNRPYFTSIQHDKEVSLQSACTGNTRKNAKYKVESQKEITEKNISRVFSPTAYWLHPPDKRCSRAVEPAEYFAHLSASRHGSGTTTLSSTFLNPNKKEKNLNTKKITEISARLAFKLNPQ